MAEITWTAEAQRWLEDIFEYIAADNPQAAAQTVSGIYERAQVLANFPEMGHRYWASSRHVRILLYGHYRITYLIKADGNIDILGVFHGSLDIRKGKRGRKPFLFLNPPPFWVRKKVCIPFCVLRQWPVLCKDTEGKAGAP